MRERGPRREYLGHAGDALQGHGVQGLVLALEEQLQGRQQEGLVPQQRAQLLHTLKPQARV